VPPRNDGGVYRHCEGVSPKQSKEPKNDKICHSATLIIDN